MVLLSCGPKPESKPVQAVSVQKAQPNEYYTCPMHPFVRSDKPGACPVCHMSLVKVIEDKDHTDSVEQRGSVSLSHSEQILADVSTAVVESKSLIKQIQAVGKIDLAEPNTQQITARFGGRIERLFVSFVGQKVHAGEPLAEIYSPDAVAAQREFLIAVNSPTSTSGESALLQQTRLKLKLWGFTDQQLQQLAKDQLPATALTIYSPLSGTVLKKNVNPQQYISTGESLFEVSDLRSLWLQIDVYETDIAAVHIGQAVEVFIDAVPSRAIKGRVSFISPTLDPTTRTARVRAILDNSTGNFSPEMYARATILVPLASSLVVPTTAVVSNGKTDLVWTETQPGTFSARRVVLGERSDEFYQILDGLLEGDIIAVKGAYLIDSESQLRLNQSRGAAK
jgi:membrane fusion protein, copper/silver efflux system